MSDIAIQSGTGRGSKAKVTDGNRLTTLAVSVPFSGAASRLGRLYGVGTGGLSVTDSFSLGSVLWLRNDDNENEYHVTDLIFGWAGTTATCFSLIHYNTGEPSGNNTSIDAQVENITKASGSNPGTLTDFTAYKWDGTGTGMTTGSGGFAQIPNTIWTGNTSLPIDGEIILGKGDSMEFRVTPGESATFHVAVVFAVVPNGGFEELF